MFVDEPWQLWSSVYFIAIYKIYIYLCRLGCTGRLRNKYGWWNGDVVLLNVVVVVYGYSCIIKYVGLYGKVDEDWILICKTNIQTHCVFGYVLANMF